MLDPDARPLRSRSDFESFSCPFRYHKIVIQGVRDTSDAARRGSTFHVATRIYTQALALRGEASDVDLAAEAVHRACVEEQTPAHLIPDVDGLWQGWVERFELDVRAFLLAEERQGVDRRTFRPDVVYAFPDVLEVRDYKTHWQILTEAQAGQELQARMYGWLASQIWPGFARYRFVFDFVRYHHEVVVEFDLGALDEIARQLDTLEAAIDIAEQTQTFPAIPGAGCRYCHLACPLTDDAQRLPVRVTSAEAFARLAGEALVLQRAYDERWEALKAFAAFEGPQIVGGMEFAFRPRESLSFPAVPVLDALRERQADASKLTFSKSDLKSFLMAKKYAHIKAALDPLGTTKTSTVFSAKKAGVEGDDPDKEA
jgi:hypothetical protein